MACTVFRTCTLCEATCASAGCLHRTVSGWQPEPAIQQNFLWWELHLTTAAH
jgi:hypothetical protein